MSPVSAIPLLLVVGLALGALAYYGVVLVRVVAAARRLPSAAAGLALPGPAAGWPRVCVVVPAHNEEDVIEAHVESLLRQDYPELRIVFALDRCTDDTEAIVRRVAADPSEAGLDPRVEIVVIGRCPDGWAGKAHAAWRGVQDSRGARGSELLLFTDSDTIFQPGLVRAAVALLDHRGLDLLSLLSALPSVRWFETLVQPAAAFELVRRYPLDLVNRPERPRAFANGQFMLFRRGTYDRLGGHEAVRHELLEDLAFARALEQFRKTSPVRWGVLMPGGLLTCRMYRSWSAFARGWKRIYTEATRRHAARLSELAWRLRLTGVLLPLSCVVGIAAGAVVLWTGDGPLGWSLFTAGILGLGATAAAIGRLYRDQGVPLRWAPMYPIGAWMVAGLLSEAAGDLRAGRKTVWAGREYAREARL